MPTIEQVGQAIAVPAVLTSIAFLAFSSQYLFLYGQDYNQDAFTRSEKIQFNTLVGALLISYYRTCRTDPGRIPREWQSVYPRPRFPGESEQDRQASERMKLRLCRKCDCWKPQRSHHCRVCRRCVPRMDHHCPWTANCVSSRTIPHFIRFLAYAVLSMIYLEMMLWQRCTDLWEDRHWPSYLGPTPLQLCHLLLLISINSSMLFAIALMFGSSVWNLVFNMTIIEAWELERHEAVVRRARTLSDCAYTADGRVVKVVRQEFPFDIGFWANAVQVMGTSNVLLWAWPFAATPDVTTALYYPTNGFEDPSLSWPPHDPTEESYVQRPIVTSEFDAFDTNDDRVASFKERQEADKARHRRSAIVTDGDGSVGFQEHEGVSSSGATGTGADPRYWASHGQVEELGLQRRGRWENEEGEKLGDFGVQDDDDDDDMPLSELLSKRAIQQRELLNRG